MIDTDKYEGHTKGDNEVGWRISNNFVSNGECPNLRYIAYVQDGEVMEFSDADANLIADAPLILEEVKRLYELHALVGVPIAWKIDYGDGGGYETFVADAVVWNYDDSGEWGLVNYKETRWMTLETAKEWMKND